jgi:hypothetical protein
MKPRGGMVCIGYQPKAGRPVGPDGLLLLQPMWIPEALAHAREKPEPVSRRGAAQERLL